MRLQSGLSTIKSPILSLHYYKKLTEGKTGLGFHSRARGSGDTNKEYFCLIFYKNISETEALDEKVLFVL
jgi:hypothetical protein